MATISSTTWVCDNCGRREVVQESRGCSPDGWACAGFYYPNRIVLVENSDLCDSCSAVIRDGLLKRRGIETGHAGELVLPEYLPSEKAADAIARLVFTRSQERTVRISPRWTPKALPESAGESKE